MSVKRHPKSRPVSRAKLLVGSTLVIGALLVTLASTASARFLTYGGATSQSGGRAQMTLVGRIHRHKLTLSLTAFTVSASFKCADGSTSPILADPNSKFGPVSRRGYFAGSVPVNPGGTQSFSGQVARSLNSVTGTFQANYVDPTHGKCDTGTVTWTATRGG
jgi:hypothetical protein